MMIESIIIILWSTYFVYCIWQLNCRVIKTPWIIQNRCQVHQTSSLKTIRWIYDHLRYISKDKKCNSNKRLRINFKRSYKVFKKNLMPSRNKLISKTKWSKIYKLRTQKSKMIKSITLMVKNNTNKMKIKTFWVKTNQLIMELIVKLTRKINPTIYQNSHRQTKKIMIQIKFHKMLIKINRKQIKINPMNWKLYMLTKMEILRVRSLKKLKKVQL